MVGRKSISDSQKKDKEVESQANEISQEAFEYNFRKYLEKCHYTIGILKEENANLKTNYKKAEDKLRETEQIQGFYLKPLLKELSKASKTSHKFFKRQKQVLNVFHLIMSLPTLDQDTISK